MLFMRVIFGLGRTAHYWDICTARVRGVKRLVLGAYYSQYIDLPGSGDEPLKDAPPAAPPEMTTSLQSGQIYEGISRRKGH